MKRIILSAIIALSCVQIIFADRIILRNTDILEGKITLVGDEIIKYTKTGENFDKEVAISDIFKIKYDNGEETVFKSSQTTPNQSVSPDHYQLVQTEPDWDSMPQASQVCQVGDWYSENGIEGVVIWTTEDGRHGRIIYPKKFYTVSNLPKPFFTGPVDIAIGTNDASNGYANLQTILKFIENNPQYPLSMFPLVEDLLKAGGGWYLPSIQEIEYLEMLCQQEVTIAKQNHKYSGKTIKYKKLINHTLKSNGGDKLSTEAYTISSTEGYCHGGASQGLELLFGDPVNPQFALYKREVYEKSSFCIRNRAVLTCTPFHLF